MNPEQHKQFSQLYLAAAEPSDRLPHTDLLKEWAATIGVEESEVWKHIMHLRSSKGLPEIEAKAMKRRPPLDPDHCEAFECWFKEKINSAEHILYSPMFFAFCVLNPERTQNEWAYDLIRYRKWKLCHDPGVMPAKPGTRRARVRNTEGRQRLQRDGDEPIQCVIATHEKDRMAFIGPGPAPNGFVFLREIDEDECEELQRTFRNDRITGCVYRVERRELEATEECVL